MGQGNAKAPQVLIERLHFAQRVGVPRASDLFADFFAESHGSQILKCIARCLTADAACGKSENLTPLAKPAGVAAAPALQSLRKFVLDGASSSPGLQPVEPRAHADARDTIASLQYTSGSTSQPKGVAIAHGNLAHQCATIRAVSASSRSFWSARTCPRFAVAETSFRRRAACR